MQSFPAKRTAPKAFWTQTVAIGIKLPPLHPETWAHDLIEGRAATIIIGMYSLWMQ